MSVNGGTEPKPSTILEKIYAQRQKDVEQAKATPGTSPEDLKTYLEMQLAPPLIPVIPRLKSNPSTSTSNPSLSLMAEIKVRSLGSLQARLYVNLRLSVPALAKDPSP